MGEEASFDVDTIPVHFMPGIFDVAAQWQQIEKKATALGGVVFVAVDTAPAYFTGDEENSNTQLGAHARKLRTLTTLPGRPTVIANCHPTKSANSDSLIPRGGGAFLGEVDGNLTSVREDRVVRLHWAGKIRGPDFEAVPFELVTIRTPRLVDSKGRQLPTVMARPLTPIEETNREEEARKDEDAILAAMKASPGASVAKLAETVGWTVGAGGAPHKSKVDRVLKRLKNEKLVEQQPREMASDQGREGGIMTTSKSPEIRRSTPWNGWRCHRSTFSGGTKSGTGTLKPPQFSRRLSETTLSAKLPGLRPPTSVPFHPLSRRERWIRNEGTLQAPAGTRKMRPKNMLIHDRKSTKARSTSAFVPARMFVATVARHLEVWLSRCATCGEPFEFFRPAATQKPFAPSRRWHTGTEAGRQRVAPERHPQQEAITDDARRTEDELRGHPAALPRQAIRMSDIRAIDSIVIGGRHRRDMGDIASLAASIAQLGLLHPVVVNQKGELIAGERRLAACRSLGWTDVPVTVVDLVEIVRGELAENADRKDFLPSEIEAIRRALLPKEKEAARTDVRRRSRESFHTFEGRQDPRQDRGVRRRLRSHGGEDREGRRGGGGRAGEVRQAAGRHGPHRRVNGVYRRLLTCSRRRRSAPSRHRYPAVPSASSSPTFPCLTRRTRRTLRGGVFIRTRR